MPRRAEPWKRKGRSGWWAWVDGRQVKLADGGPKSDAWDALHRKLAESAAGSSVRSNATLYEAAGAFLDHSRATQHPSTYAAHRWRLKAACDRIGERAPRPARYASNRPAAIRFRTVFGEHSSRAAASVTVTIRPPRR